MKVNSTVSETFQVATSRLRLRLRLPSSPPGALDRGALAALSPSRTVGTPTDVACAVLASYFLRQLVHSLSRFVMHIQKLQVARSLSPV